MPRELSPTKESSAPAAPLQRSRRADQRLVTRAPLILSMRSGGKVNASLARVAISRRRARLPVRYAPLAFQAELAGLAQRALRDFRRMEIQPVAPALRAIPDSLLHIQEAGNVALAT